MREIDPKSELSILLKMPNWLGDSVMVSATLELLKSHFPNASFSLVGVNVACEIYRRDPRVKKIFIDSTKNFVDSKNPKDSAKCVESMESNNIKSQDSAESIESTSPKDSTESNNPKDSTKKGLKSIKNRLKATIALAKEIGKHDIAITFSNGFFSSLLLYHTKTPIRIGYSKRCAFFLTHKIRFVREIHQVSKYLNLANELCKRELITQNSANDIANYPLKLFAKPNLRNPNKLKCIGISPGAAYGSAKQWEARYFTEIVMDFLESDCLVFLFGAKGDDVLSGADLMLKSCKNYANLHNLIGKTDISTLCDYIASMDLFITNDSGAMHIAAALNVPIIAMFGPTDSSDTSPWSENAILLDKKLPCAPCKKRECPLGHHNCMKLILPDEVIENANLILSKAVK